MLLDLVLGLAHHLIMFALVGVLVVEMMLVRRDMAPARMATLARIDAAFGGLAALMPAAGFGRVFFGLKGSEFYLGNPVFWAKIAAFLVVAALSVVPTVKIIRWARAAAADAGFRPDVGEVQFARRFMLLEALVFILIPVLAAMMARGYGV